MDAQLGYRLMRNNIMDGCIITGLYWWKRGQVISVSA